VNEEHAYNRKILYTIILFLLVIAGVGLKFFYAQKRENSALRVKILSLNKVKKIPLPWSRLTQESIEIINKQAAASKTKAITPAMPIPTLTPVAKLINEIPIVDQPTEQLAKSLTQNMLGINNLDLAGVNKNIEMADEIISREPSTYSAYKAKLISMIVKESKFNQAVDEYDFNKVLDNMAGFEVNNDATLRREAALIATTNNQLIALSNTLNDISILKDEISTQSSALDKSSAEYQELQLQSDQLDQREQATAESLENLQNNLNTETQPAVNLNEDIVEIPFLRLLAKGDYDAVNENAQSFIEQFPNSPIGYYYLVKSLELQGRTDDAIRVIEEATLTPENQSSLLERLDASSGEDPTKYWEKLRF
jgi:tetratricopeptide (TPR) repeat protein